MGYDSREIRVTAIVSRHNSPRDKSDDELWDELNKRIEELVNEEKYKAITAMTAY